MLHPCFLTILTHPKWKGNTQKLQALESVQWSISPVRAVGVQSCEVYCVEQLRWQTDSCRQIDSRATEIVKRSSCVCCCPPWTNSSQGTTDTDNVWSENVWKRRISEKIRFNILCMKPEFSLSASADELKVCNYVSWVTVHISAPFVSQIHSRPLPPEVKCQSFQAQSLRVKKLSIVSICSRFNSVFCG